MDVKVGTKLRDEWLTAVDVTSVGRLWEVRALFDDQVVLRCDYYAHTGWPHVVVPLAHLHIGYRPDGEPVGWRALRQRPPELLRALRGDDREP